MATPPPPKRRIENWLDLNAGNHDCATHLAETAIDVLELPQAWLDDDTHWIWDSAMLTWTSNRGIAWG
jgi:hypothetical protein